MESFLPYWQCDLPTAIPQCLSWHTSTFLRHTCCLPQNNARTPSMPDVAHQVSHDDCELSVKIKPPLFFKNLFQSPPNSCRCAPPHTDPLTTCSTGTVCNTRRHKKTTANNITRTGLHLFSIPPISLNTILIKQRI